MVAPWMVGIERFRAGVAAKRRQTGWSRGPCGASEEVQEQRNDGDQQNQMNQGAGNMEQDEAAKPDDEKKNGNQQKWSESHKAPVVEKSGIEGHPLVPAIVPDQRKLRRGPRNIGASPENRKKEPLRMMETLLG
jgi:hypothetical protein